MKHRTFGVLLLLLCLLGLAGAQTPTQLMSDSVLPSAPGYMTTAISAADTATFDSPIRPRLTKGMQHLCIAPTFSVSNATACLVIVQYQRTSSTDSFCGIASVVTFTAMSLPGQTVDSGRFAAKPLAANANNLGTANTDFVVSIEACQTVDIRVQSISSGDVKWRAWMMGDKSRALPSTNE